MKSLKTVTIALVSGVAIGGAGATLLHAQTPKPPPAYVVAEFTVKDQDAFRDYGQKVGATLTPHTGKFLARGGKIEALKGDAPKGPFVILTFDSADQAKKWAASSEYAQVIPVRDKGADSRIFMVEGLAP